MTSTFGYPHPAGAPGAQRTTPAATPLDRRDRRPVRRSSRHRLRAAKDLQDRDRKAAPYAADVEAWAAATNTDAAELLELLELLDRARTEYASFRDRFIELAGADRAQDALGAVEHAATRIAHYEPVIVPGILQTADYARELLRLPSGPARSGADEAEISRMIASRLRRQAILYEPGREITLLLGEGALHTRVASPPTMQAQREHIARLAETLTTATIGILPFSAQAPIAALHGWLLTDDLATIETDAGNLEVADPHHVDRYWHHTCLLLDAAATGANAAGICRDINAHAAG